jgi:hypothetical protein
LNLRRIGQKEDEFSPGEKKPLGQRQAQTAKDSDGKSIGIGGHLEGSGSQTAGNSAGALAEIEKVFLNAGQIGSDKQEGFFWIDAFPSQTHGKGCRDLGMVKEGDVPEGKWGCGQAPCEPLENAAGPIDKIERIRAAVFGPPVAELVPEVLPRLKRNLAGWQLAQNREGFRRVQGGDGHPSGQGIVGLRFAHKGGDREGMNRRRAEGRTLLLDGRI